MVGALRELARRRRKALAGVVFAAAAALLVLWAVRTPARVYGDGGEYFLMLESVVAHGSPEYRLNQPRWTAEPFGWDHPVSAEGVPAGYVSGRQPGKAYSIHFWAYSALAAPVRLLLGLSGQPQSASFQLFNVALLAGAVGIATFAMRAPLRSRLLFVGLATASPVLWYLPWPHPEVFSWSAVSLAMVALHARAFPLAAAAAALGALHNPPIALLALLALVRAIREGSRRDAALALGAAALSAVPPLYYLWATGHPNPIVATGTAGLANVSVSRVWSFVADLNQGLLPFVPLLLLLGVASVACALVRRDGEALGLALTLGLMMAASTATANWNAGCAGLLRYAVWTLPILAYLAAFHPPPGRFVTLVGSVAVVLHAGVVAFGWQRVARRPSWVEQSPVAAFVLRHAPRLYSPEPEIFAERQLGWSWAGLTLANDPRPSCPITFEDRDGVVTKVLTDAASLPHLSDCHVVSPEYLGQLAAQRTRTGLFYLEPPRGAVVARATLSPELLVLCREKIVRNRAAFVSQRARRAADGTWSVVIRMRNTGTSTWTKGAYRLEPVGAGASVELARDVSPGDGHAFEFTTPDPGSGVLRWKMREGSREQFDEATPPLELSEVGAEAIDLLAEADRLEGFHDLERDAGGTWRWTNGAAVVHFATPARTGCKLVAKLYAPAGVELWFDQHALTPDTTGAHPLGDLWAGQHTLALRSQTFVPARSGQSSDERTLGVSVARLAIRCTGSE